MKRLFIGIGFLSFSAFAFSAEQSITAKELLIDVEHLPTPPGILTQAQVARDVQVGLFAFRNGYSGYQNIDSRIVHAAELEMLAIPEHTDGQSPQSVCELVSKAFAKIPDSHLRARFKTKNCAVVSYPEGHVGRNVAPPLSSAYSHPWKLMSLIVDGTPAKVLSITSFPRELDPSWSGFEAAFKSLVHEKFFIIDMRGNGGGDDSWGYSLARWLCGHKIPSVAIEKRTRQTPAAFALQMNGQLLAAHKSILGNQAATKYAAEYREQFELAETGKLPADKVESLIDGADMRAGSTARPFAGQVYVLVDRRCASSCESTLEALRAFSNTKVVGENTAGFIHFGNVGVIVLPESGIELAMGTHYYRYKDDQLFEKVGFPPDLSVPPGKDALTFAVQAYAGFKK